MLQMELMNRQQMIQQQQQQQQHQHQPQFSRILMGGSIVEPDPSVDHAAAAAASAAAAEMQRVLTTRHHGQDIICSGEGITGQSKTSSRPPHNVPELSAPLSTSSHAVIAPRVPVAEIFPPFSLEEHKAKYEQASERARR